MLDRRTRALSWTRSIALVTALLVASLAALVAAPAHAAPAAPSGQAERVAAAAARDCRTSEVPCRYRTVKFRSGSRIYYAIKREINLRPARSNPLPRCQNYVARIFEDGSSRVVSCTANTRVVVSRWGWGWFGDPGFWSTTWKVTKCVASVTLAIVPLAKAGSIVKSLGGIRKTAELLVKAGNWSDVRKAAPALAGEILGISAIATNCF
ncbi:hypothetical protein BJ993_003595 [Nocardioides aromaticivorans]|uniref:Uncharacterized protein n=1 Tax=Nocardioides aromaticivorans TaxID=200618 RepID=A0A7Z0CQ22_9ACTN|nr:hypothetical protein [Nocardioides aromaticivorans]NYI46515.1 hypothetical protein [Nocardioides aromaticivorans]